MQWLDKSKLAKELLTVRSLTWDRRRGEVAASLGRLVAVADYLEHGNASLAELRNLLLACSGSKSAPIVRLRSVEADDVKFVMDSGAAGIMFPFVNSASEAARAVECIKYPPMGKRGVAGIIRSTGYGANWKTYFEEANAKSWWWYKSKLPRR